MRCRFVHRLPLIIIFLCDYTPGDRRPVLIILSTMGLPHRLKVGGLGGYSSTGEKTVMKGTRTLVHVSDPLGSTKSEKMLTKRRFLCPPPSLPGGGGGGRYARGEHTITEWRVMACTSYLPPPGGGGGDRSQGVARGPALTGA